MHRTLIPALRTAAYLAVLIALPAIAQEKKDAKADPTGTWSWTSPGRDGQTRTNTLKLKLEGDKLTGSVTGRQADTAIEDASIKGAEISFKVTREFQGNKITLKYHGKLAGDTITGKIESERDGQAQTRDWEAKREAAKPKA